MSGEVISLGFLLLALGAYTLFGGADFGGGFLEASLWRHPRLQKRLQATLAPIWEANHVWLIAVVVILFVAFPGVYASLSTVLFVPLSLILLGIIARGAFFTFRKYDPEPLARLRLYSWLFRFGSMLTPAFFGFVLAALLTPFPHAQSHPEASFFDLYIAPWATLLGLLCAIFVNFLFAYLAAVFFHGELSNEGDRDLLRTRIWSLFAGTFLSGAMVLAWGVSSGEVSAREALSPVQIAAQGIALGCVFGVFSSLAPGRKWRLRLAVGLQTLAILCGWFSTQYPTFLRFDDGTVLTAFNSAAPPVTLFWLNLGLAVVLSIVIPLMAFLYRVFAASQEERA
ncbi:MAG: cytochrome d ubiquinol oxidase subunit II [Deltaproteobacteria bacterium]|nr:cytochrome d ubiquinol oxidase subunit II [Deltaproteobacteria bacterium]